ncbi:unnamed protein product [Amoebophrya sp. A120]|nr:unnamed protein product [Amoebophrya sp. A120]|eukprot:GSA120T00002144001.1
MSTGYIIMGAMVWMVWSTGSLMPLFYCFLGVFLLLICQLIWKQEEMLYVPEPMPGMLKPEDNPAGFRSPAEFKLPYEDVFFKSADSLTLHAWWIPGAGTSASSSTGGAGVSIRNRTKAPANCSILFCHANAGNIGMRLPNFVDLAKRCNANVFAFDYRGFGKSEGKPSEQGLILDGLASLYEMKSKYGIEETFIFGRSLGGAVAVSLVKAIEDFTPEVRAKYPRIKGIMLENTFTSISDLADKLFPFLAYLKPIKAFFLRINWDSMAQMKTFSKTTTKVLFLVGEKDELVPPEHSRKLCDACPCPTTFASFPEGMHNDTYHKGGLKYWEYVQGFLND